MAWLNGYGYRQKIPLKRVAGAVTDYQRLLNVHKGAGDSSVNDCYLKNHALSWEGAIPNDLRFTKADGSTELHYWIESSDANDAVVHIEFDSIGTTDTDFYVYYGKVADTTTSNGDATWEDYDQFDDLDDWVASPTKTIMHTDATHVFLGTYAAMKDELDEDTIEKDYGSALTGRRVRWWFYDDGEAEAPYADACGFFDDTPDFCIIGRRDLTSTTHYMYRIAGVWTATAVARVTGWHLAEFLIWAADDIDGYIDETKIFDSANINGIQKPAAGSWWGQNGDYWVGAFCVGKLASPEPTWGTWGSEEAAPVVGFSHGYIIG